MSSAISASAACWKNTSSGRLAPDEVTGSVDLGEQFPGQPNGGHFVVGVAGRESGTRAFPARSLRFDQMRSSSGRIP